MHDDTVIKANDVFTHLESGNAYVVVAVGMMKNEGGEWEDAITYAPCDQPARIFTRRTVSFRELFKRGAKSE